MKVRTHIGVVIVSVALAIGITTGFDRLQGNYSYADEWAQVTEEARNSGNAYFIEVMEDGRMDLAEYELTAALIVTCVNLEFPGIEPPPYSLVRDESRMIIQFMFTSTAEHLDSGVPQAVIDDCKGRHAMSAMVVFRESYLNPGGPS